MILSGSLIFLLLGEWLKGLRNYESAALELQSDGISMISATKNVELKYEDIKKFKGVMNLVQGMKSTRKLNFIIKTVDNKKIEIRSHSYIFNELTDYFPDKFNVKTH